MVIKLKMRWIVLLCFTVATACVLIYTSLRSEEQAVAAFPMRNRIIVIDAGHGGLDGGASDVDGVCEKDINLNIAKYLEVYLKQSGAKVVMTRTKDISLHTNDNTSVKNRKREDLLKRREIANTSGADLMVSIHLNCFEQTKYSGAQVFYEPNFAESKALAATIQNAMRENLNKQNNRVEQKIAPDKLQFQNLSVPTALIECGFLSNPDEAALLKTPEYQQKVALAIYLGIIYFYNAG